MVWTKGLGSAPPPRLRNSTCLVDNKSMVVFGGKEKEALNDLFAYNISRSPPNPFVSFHFFHNFYFADLTLVDDRIKNLVQASSEW